MHDAVSATAIRGCEYAWRQHRVPVCPWIFKRCFPSGLLYAGNTRIGVCRYSPASGGFAAD